MTNLIGVCDVKLAWYSPSATRQICLYGLEQGVRILSERCGFCNPNKISWAIWLMYCDQLRLHLSHKKIRLLPWHYGLLRTRLYVHLTNHPRYEAKYNVSPHQLPLYYLLLRVLLSTACIDSVTWYTCYNLAYTKMLPNLWPTPVFNIYYTLAIQFWRETLEVYNYSQHSTHRWKLHTP